jgi:hypothetical protein
MITPFLFKIVERLSKLLIATKCELKECEEQLRKALQGISFFVTNLYSLTYFLFDNDRKVVERR